MVRKKLADAQAAAVDNTLTQPAQLSDGPVSADGKYHTMSESREPRDDTATEKPKPRQPYTHIQRGSHDNAARVEMAEYRSTEKTLFPEDNHNGTFVRLIYFADGKPSDAVRQILKDNGFEFDRKKLFPAGEWFSTEQPWYLKIPYNGSGARKIADITYAKVVNQIRKEKGIEPDTFSRDPFLESV